MFCNPAYYGFSFLGIYLTFKVTGDVPVTHVAANTDFTVPSPSVVTISCNQCFSVNKWLTSGTEREMRVKYCRDEKSRSTRRSRKGSRVIVIEYNDCGHIYALKGQYHAIFSNTLKIEKTLFG